MLQENHIVVDSNSDKLKSIIITESKVQILDQLMLPNEIKFIDLNNCEDAWHSIVKMQVRGAPMIAVVALYGLKMDLKSNEKNFTSVENLFEFIQEKCVYLKTSRPTAVNLANDLNSLITHIQKLIENLNSQNKNNNENCGAEKIQTLLKSIFDFINKNYSDYQLSATKISNNGAEIILNHPSLKSKTSLNILTICNTGKLAMPGNGTALGIIREIAKRNKLNKLFIPETRPYNQGSRLTAFEALHDNLPGTLITDSMAGILMQNKQIDCVIVGADRITKAGATANKIGTYTFSVLAHFHKIPFYVAAPESTIDYNMLSGKDIHIEERPADELRKIHNSIYIAPKDIKCYNPSFDVTPPQLIEAIITENGSFNFEKSLGFWKKLDKKEIEIYIKKFLPDFLKIEDKLEIEDIADGNLNLVYKIKAKSSAFCLKQALPYVKCVGPEWELSLERINFESASLQFAQRITPQLVPKFISFDDDYKILIMEFLENHFILRKELINEEQIENLGEILGKYIAQNSFYSSNVHLSPERFREQISFWNGNKLCALTEQVIFSDPYVNACYNHWTAPFLDGIIAEIRSDKRLICAVRKLREKFICKKQAIIHGDLHSGSIMVNKQEKSVKVIDAEFAFCGPIGFDVGMLIANFFMNYFSKYAKRVKINEELNKEDKENGEKNKLLDNLSLFESYILEQIKTTWEAFRDEFLKLWSDPKNRFDEFPGMFEAKMHADILIQIQDDLLKKIFEETLGFCGVEIIRRIIGIAHNADFETIENLELKGKSEIKALRFAIDIINNMKRFERIEEVLIQSQKFYKD
jgi:5-methylthioribose kinase